MIRRLIVTALAAAVGLTAVATLPLILLKPGRFHGGSLSILPVPSHRAAAVLFAGDLAFILGAHLLRSVLLPRRALLPIGVGLALAGIFGFLAGALGPWGHSDPWNSPGGTPLTDRVGLLSAGLAALALGLFRHQDEKTSRAPARVRKQDASTRVYRGLILAVMLGWVPAIAGAYLAAGAAALWGWSPAVRTGAILWTGFALGMTAQVAMIEAGLRGKILAGSGTPGDTWPN